MSGITQSCVPITFKNGRLLVMAFTFLLGAGSFAQSQVPPQPIPGQPVPAEPLKFTLGPIQTVPNPGIPGYPYSPDGHFSYLPDGDRFQMYWPNDTSYRTVGTSVFDMREPVALLGPGAKGEFDNGGAWIYSVARREGDRLIGFYHAEDREFTGDPASRFIAWKSIGVCDSIDNGKTWRKGGQIIATARTKPIDPKFGGNGDFCVVKDTLRNRWMCFYQEGTLCMASSTDPEGKPGTWKKYFQGDFTTPGLGGENSPIPGLEDFRGGNPSVHFNSYLNKWIMVWHTWHGLRDMRYTGSIMLSTSDDLVRWSAPQVLLQATLAEKFWYPTIIGTSDTTAGQQALLLYAHFPDRAKNNRAFLARTITFGTDTPKAKAAE